MPVFTDGKRIVCSESCSWLFCIIFGGLVALGAQTSTRASIAAIQKVKDNLYVIMKSDPTERSMFTGGNTAVFVTGRGVILVDTKLPGYGQDILAQVRSVTDKPVITIINTHTHNDHSGSNTEFPASIEYVAHENTRANMSKDTCPPVTNCQSFKGDNAKYLPKRTVQGHIDARCRHGPNRSCTTSVEDIPMATRGWSSRPVQTMHTGDMFQRKNMPFIDVADNGGSAVEWAETQRKALAGVKNVSTIIPGHFNGLMTWDDFAEGVAFYGDFLDTVRSAIKAGKSADATVAAYTPPAKFKHFQVDPARAKANIEAIYKELSSARQISRGDQARSSDESGSLSLNAEGVLHPKPERWRVGVGQRVRRQSLVAKCLSDLVVHGTLRLIDLAGHAEREDSEPERFGTE